MLPPSPPTPPPWRLSPSRTVDLSAPAVMAILNFTPDSFSDGGSYPTLHEALAAARAAAEAGAAILDIGGESTRPGAARVPVDEQIRRTVPLIEAIRAHPGPLGNLPITIDTTLAPVARAALDAGADAVNDVSAGLEDPGLLPLAAERSAGVVLMHRLHPPDADSYSDRYARPPEYPGGVVRAVRDFLASRAAAAERAGIPRAAVVLDPGLGFGKTVEQNLQLITGTPTLAELGYPILSGLSRKSFVGRAAGLPPDSAPRDRAAATLALSVLHRLHGASVFRVHEPAPAAQALRALDAARSARREP